MRSSAFLSFALLVFVAAVAQAAGADRPRDVQLPGGYKIVAVARGLNWPTGVAFGDSGTIYVTEAGVPGGVARIVRVGADGSVSEVARGFNAPVIDVKVHNGWLYVSHQGTISRIRPDGTSRQDLITGLPSQGDHSNEEITFGPDGKMYFTEGSVTNSGMVGIDNFEMGWLADHPSLHDTPCADIRVHAVNVTTANPLTSDPADSATTGPFQPFGTPATEGQTIPGSVPCNGAILRANDDGTNLEMYAWGFRNPFATRFDAAGQLWATHNGMDERGSHPVEGDHDFMFKINQGDWFGWPDFSGGAPVNTEAHNVDGAIPELLLADHPALSPNAVPFSDLGDHVSANKFDFSTTKSFGFEGDAFVAETGSIPGVTGADELSGYKVLRVNMRDGSTADFLTNKSGLPAFATGGDGINKPIDVKFDPHNPDVMYVVDFGAFLPGPGTPEVKPVTTPNSGVLWAIGRRNSLHGLPTAGAGAQVALVLGDATPNPSRGAVDIQYANASDAHLTLAVYDVSGRLVRTVVDAAQAAGSHTARWDGNDQAGNRALQGVYFYRMSDGITHTERKILLLGR